MNDVNLFSVFRASDENVKAELKCVKFVISTISTQDKVRVKTILFTV